MFINSKYYDCVQWLWLGDWRHETRGTCMCLFLPKSYQEIKQSTLEHTINIYKPSLITPKESRSSSMQVNVLPKWILSLLSVKDQKRKVAHCFGYLIIEQGCFWIFEHFGCIPFFSLPSLVASSHVAGKTAKALLEYMHSHMASVSKERAFFDLDRVTGLRVLGGGWERKKRHVRIYQTNESIGEPAGQISDSSFTWSQDQANMSKGTYFCDVSV